ncbi:hypothetical protein [Actinoplanes teichomyceticus]|uniref:DNA-binding protein n=1 Tax=Actinoplanes teichomyceticus TaxID=1867 RepID=A0A561WC18_ACTTI|nr:hypothetical protein [Actinoplanes teichomyceticus]TWG21416.1 hypothetical protein FHX34_103954 [Actinoplanes teichomyceticus]GIF16610.1 hypothetical protein Ate01nite_66420 [Actinoplanes teichomyceticus]
MTLTVRFDPPRVWYFGGERRYDDGVDSIVIKRGDLAVSTATDLVRAMRKAHRAGWGLGAVQVDVAPEDEYEPKGSFVEPISFVLLVDGRLGVQCDLVTGDYYDPFDEDDHFYEKVATISGPFLKRYGAQLVNAVPDDERSSSPYYHKAILAVPTRSKTLESLYRIGDGVRALFAAASTGVLTRRTVQDLVVAGRADLLIGQPEGPWLDVKSAHYDLTTPKGRISLAQAVSRFANAEQGGIVVAGMGTKKIPGGELIDSIKPVPVDTGTVRRYRQAIETTIFPFPVGLEIRSVETGPGIGLVTVSLPPQEEELKPFLVHGAIVGDRVEGAFISIVRRSGEDSIPITAAQIHSTLAAGRALLRRGHVPQIDLPRHGEHGGSSGSR